MTGFRRHGDTRRIEIAAGQHRVEIDVPATTTVARGDAIAITPTRYRIYPGEFSGKP